jgi:hypothetical protein
MSIFQIIEQHEDAFILNIRYETNTYTNQRWYKCNSRVPGRCAGTGQEYLAGTTVYRPEGNPGNRIQRMLPEAFTDKSGYEPVCTETRECDTCHVELPLTAKYFAHPQNRKEFRTTCRTCMQNERHQRKKETVQAKKEKIVQHKAEGIRTVTFPDTWHPNRDGARSSIKDMLGICSGLG